jgi:hypothetical protein
VKKHPLYVRNSTPELRNRTLAGDMAQVAGHLPRQRESFHIPGLPKRRKRNRKKEREGGRGREEIKKERREGGKRERKKKRKKEKKKERKKNCFLSWFSTDITGYHRHSNL